MNIAHAMGHLVYPPPDQLPVLQKLKAAYLVWVGYHAGLPKTQRYTLGGRIDGLFVETMEALAVAGFTPRGEKLPYVRLATRKLDTLKLLVMVLWETKVLDSKKYAALSALVDEVGRMLGGWHDHLVQQSSPARATGER